jgi:Terminase large subunit, T4likevirus-type, N-terminal
MPRQCEVCIAPNRPEFEAAVAAGQSVRKAAVVHGLHLDAAYRHIRNHGRAQRPRAVEPWTPVDTFRAAFGDEPMAHQVAYLASTGHLLVRKGRQVGMTQAAAALAIHVARERAGNLAAVISPSLRQSTEVAARARLGLWALGDQLVQDSVSLLRLRNGSRILSLPGSARGVRGYAASLVIVDEAAWADDGTFTAVRALVAATGGRVIVQSTPGSPVGFFHELATNTPPDWSTLVVRSDEARTISPEFLERERREMSEELFNQEYMAEFGTGIGSGPFNLEALRALVQEAT